MTENNHNDTKQAEPAAPAVQRTFIIGDQWLYYKFYAGPKTADVILTRMIKPLTEHLLASGAIDKWFFIRYSDPKLHTRVRFHVSSPQATLNVIQAINNMSKPFIQQDLIWKVQVDSYQREIERYGAASMELGETVFFHDSRMITDMLDMIEGDEGERIRWLFALRTIDTMLEDFHFSMEDKYDMVTRWRENFGREHGMNRSLKEQMEKKFRRDRKEITGMLNHVGDEESPMAPLFQLIQRKSDALRSTTEEIISLYKDSNPNFIKDLMGSYSHMMINRLFKSKQRTHELVLYDFLHRFYKSEIARAKYSQMNRGKKKKKSKDKK